MGLLDRGHRVAVVADAIHPFDNTSETAVLATFFERGAFLVATEIVCSE
jgi:hypothetical protein